VVAKSVRPRWEGTAADARCTFGNQAAQAAQPWRTRAAVEAEGGQHTRGVLGCKGQAVAAALALQQSRESKEVRQAFPDARQQGKL
jgi:hypothetical protein